MAAYDPRFQTHHASQQAILSGDTFWPHNTAAEMDVLSIISEKTERVHTMELTDDHFFEARNKALFKAIKSLSLTYDVVTVADVVSKLGGEENINMAGGYAYINEALSNKVSEFRMFDRVHEVKSTFKRREAIRAAISIAKKASSSSNADELLPFINSELSKVAGFNEHKDVAGKSALEAFKSRVKAFKETGLPPSLITNVEPFDALFRGQIIKNKPTYLVWGATPGTGKSALTGQVLYEMIKQGQFVFFASLEMPTEAVIDRMVAYVSRISLTTIRLGNLHPKIEERVLKAYEHVTDLVDKYAEIFYKAGMTVEEFEAKLLAFKARKGGIDMAAIDYLQLLQTSQDPKKTWGDPQRIAHCSLAVRDLSRKASIPILALTQLTPEKSTDVPDRSHIRGSKQIDQDADIVVLMHALVKGDKQIPPIPHDKIHMNFCKGRSEQMNQIDCVFTGGMMEFSLLSPDDECPFPNSGA